MAHTSYSHMISHTDNPEAEPRPGCRKCPRLVGYRRDNKRLYPDYFNGATGSFGDINAAIALIGLAPGLHGANRTGRAFTGDQSGVMLFDCLKKEGFCIGDFNNSADDGLALNGLMITNALRCAPPQNKPTPDEVKNCQPFLHKRLKLMPHLKVVIALGRVAHDTLVRSYGGKISAYPFAHQASHVLEDTGLTLVDSYHCSRYNQNTGRITQTMLRAVLQDAKKAATL